MSLISRLGVVLGLDTAEFSAGLGKADNDLKKFSVSSLAVGASVTAMGTAFVAASYQALSFADGINDIAKANEMAVGSVLEFSQALSTNGGDSEKATKLLSDFTNKVDEAASGSQKARDKFKEVGVSLKDLGNLSEEDLLRKTIDGLSRIEDPIKRNAMAFDLLGKSAKGVDIKGLNEEFTKIQGTMKESDEAFKKIGDSFDKMDRLGQKIKIDLANNLAEPFDKALEAAGRFYAYLQENSEKLTKEREKNRLALAQASVDANMGWHQEMLSKLPGFGGVVEQARKQAETSHYTPMDTNWEYKPNFNAGNSPKRATPMSDEEKKLAEAAKKVSEAMMQQSLEYNRQYDSLGKIQNEYDKLMIQFEKGGKYAGQQNTELGKTLILNAKRLDMGKAFEDSEKRRLDYALQMYEKGQQLQEQAIEKKRADQETFDLATEEIDIQTRRLEYERQLVGLSDTQAKKALEYFDLQQSMVKLRRDNLSLTDDEIAARQVAEQKKIQADEANSRAQKTFQAGWNKAYSNFVERAQDSAAMAADAFNSMATGMENALDTFVKTGKLSFGDLAQSIIADLIKIQLKAQITGLFGGGGGLINMFGSLFGGGGVGADTSFDTYYNMSSMGAGNARASGGDITAGTPYLVGENGPELVIPGRSGTVVPNHSLSSVMGNQPQVVYNGTVVQNMSAIDTQSAVQFLAQNKTAVWSANQSAQRSLPMSR